MAEEKSTLSRDQIIRLLEKVGENLAGQSVMGEIAIYGGSALTLMYDFRESTHDVDFTAMDPVNNGQYAVMNAAKQVSLDEDINEDWMSDAVEVFVSDNPDFRFFGEFPKDNPGIRIFIASPEYIFAMKILSSMRSTMVSSDIEDIWNLIDECEINSLDEAKQRLEKFFPNKQLPRKHELILMDIYEAKEHGKAFDRSIGW